jgi:hypothetical protein
MSLVTRIAKALCANAGGDPSVDLDAHMPAAEAVARELGQFVVADSRVSLTVQHENGTETPVLKNDGALVKIGDTLLVRDRSKFPR